MIWGAITYDHKGPITILDQGRMTGSKYITMILEPHLIPFWMKMMETLGLAEVMEDGAAVHRCAISKKYRQAHGLTSIPWPAQSPDLNPLENLWRILKHRISRRVEGRPRSIDEMKALLQAEWEELDISTWKNMIESMPKRVQECIDAEGGSTHY